MIDKRIMVRQLIEAYPKDSKFHDFVCGLGDAVLCQLHGDIVVRGAKLILTIEEWNAIPEKMGWNAPNFCGGTA